MLILTIYRLLNSSLPELTLPITNFLKATIHQEIDDVESFVKVNMCSFMNILTHIYTYIVLTISAIECSV